MPNGRLLSPESMETAQEHVVLAQTVDTYEDKGAPEEITPSREIGRECERERQRGRRSRQGGVHRSAVRDRRTDESVKPAECTLLPTALCFGRGEGEKEILRILKSKLEDMVNKKNKLKKKVARLFADLLRNRRASWTLPTPSND